MVDVVFVLSVLTFSPVSRFSPSISSIVGLQWALDADDSQIYFSSPDHFMEVRALTANRTLDSYPSSYPTSQNINQNQTETPCFILVLPHFTKHLLAQVKNLHHLLTLVQVPTLPSLLFHSLCRMGSRVKCSLLSLRSGQNQAALVTLKFFSLDHRKLITFRD